MGSSSSKAARKLPKEKPSWAGSRTPLKPDGAQEIRRPRPLAFENKTDGAYAGAVRVTYAYDLFKRCTSGRGRCKRPAVYVQAKPARPCARRPPHAVRPTSA